MAKSMTLLWGAGSPSCWRVMITLEEKKLQGYKHKLLRKESTNPRKSCISTQEGRSLHFYTSRIFSVFGFFVHRGHVRSLSHKFSVTRLPAFRHGDNILNESTAACLYLENQFKSQGNKLIPNNPAEQALMYQRMMEGLLLTDKLNSVVYYEWFVPEEERHDSAVKRNKEALAAELQLWEGYLQTVAAGSYLAGPFSLADVIVFPNTAYAFRFGLSVERYPKLGKYYSLLKDRPSIKASWPPHWLDGPHGYDILKDL